MNMMKVDNLRNVTALWDRWPVVNNDPGNNPDWETSACPLANSENWVGRVENRPGQVEFCIGYTRDYPFRASAKKFEFPSL